MELGKRRNKLVVKGVLYRVGVKFVKVDESIDQHQGATTTLQLY